MGHLPAWNIAIVAAVVLLEYGGFSQGHQCWSDVPANDTDCLAFRDFCYIFQPYHHNRTAVLVMDLRRPVTDVLVRLRSADCNFSCDVADAAPCNITTQAATLPSRIVRMRKHFVKQHYDFHNIVGKFYCATVSLDRCGKLSVVYDTSTDSFEAPANASLKRPVQLLQEPQPVAIAVSMSLAVGAIFAVAAYCIKTRLCRRPEGAPPLDEKRPSTSSSASPLLPAPAAILLLYSRDSDGFVRLMEAFRDLLAALTGMEVVDPLDLRRSLAEVMDNPVGWLSRQLRRPELRVVLVVSAGALARQRALLQGGQLAPAAGTAARPHPLDFLFTHALRHMQDDLRVASSYNRVYKVRFESITPTTETLSHIVPMTDFRLMRHIGRLVHELKGETDPPDTDDTTQSQELLRDVPEADRLFALLRELTV